MAEWYRDDDERRYRSADERGREYGGRDRQRGMYERGRDEVRSWFGDEEAERRRRSDERQSDWGYGRGSSGERYDRGYRTDEFDRGGWRDDYGRGAGRSDYYGRGGSSGSEYGRDDRRFTTTGSGAYGEAGGYGTPDRDSGRRTAGDFEPTSWSYTEIWMIPGPHTGRGPNGYQRADDRIKDDICERLTRHGQIDARDIDITVANGDVTLRGLVESRAAKRQAEDVAESVSGVREVRNELRTSSGALDVDRRPASSPAHGSPSLEAPLGLGTQTGERQATSSQTGREGSRGTKATT